MPKKIISNIKITETEASYIAGFVDGEGCFGMSYVKCRRHIRPYFRIVNTDFLIMDWLQKKLGGRLIYIKGDSIRKPKVELCLDSHSILYDIIPKLLPYMKVKNRQALAIYSWIKNRIDSNQYNKRYTEEDFIIVDKIHALNSRGGGKNS